MAKRPNTIGSDKRSSASCSPAEDVPVDAEALLREGRPVELIDIDALHAVRVRRTTSDRARDRLRFERFKREQPAMAIKRFLNHFSLTPDRAFLRRDVPDYVLEWLADRFGAWLFGKGSLDEAFGVRAQGRGKQSAREALAAVELQRLIEFLYMCYLGEEQSKPRVKGESPADRAMTRIAGELDKSVSTIKSAVHRKSSG